MTRRYLVESPHTKEECLKTLDEFSAQGGRFLSQFNWGCMAGDHTGYAVVPGSNSSDVKKMIPSLVRGKTKVVEVSKFSPAQIKGFHEM